MEILTFNLAANEIKQIRRGGVGIEVVSSAYALNVNTYTSNSGQSNTLNGILAGMFGYFRFAGFDIDNRGNPAQQVQIIVFDEGESGGCRRQPGIVNVVDAGKQRTISGQSFMARLGVGAGAGVYAGVQLFNPVASTTRAVVEAISMQCNLAGNLYAVLVNVSQTAGGAGKSKLGGGANSVSATQSATAATFNALDVLNKDLVQLSNTAGVAVGWTFKEPVVLPPGWGLLVLSDQSASPTVSAVWEFFEEPNT
jgi:hypothetical protein